MTADENEPWRPFQYHQVQFSALTDCRYLEVIKYAEALGIQRSEGRIDDASIESWLVRDLTVHSSVADGPLELLGGLRLLIGKCHWTPENGPLVLPFTKRSFDTIVEQCALPLDLGYFVGNPDIRAHNFSTTSSVGVGRQALYFKTRVWPSSYLSITLSYNNNTRVATALLLTREDGQTSLQFARHFQNNQQWCCQPLLAPLLLIEIALDDCHRLLSSHTDHLNDLQDEVGQREYGDRPIANPLSIDFVATTRKLNSSGRSFASIVATLQSFKMVLEKMVEFRKDLLLDKDEGEQDSEGMISNKIGYLFDTCRVLLTHAEYDGKRIAFLIQVVYQFMAQKDAQVNIALAETSAAIAKSSKEDSAVMKVIAMESKKDSSAMKTIAVLGMVFLPGTFVAAIFAMPIFDWDGNGAPIVKEGFRYYWAVTGPLTLVVLLLWLLIMLLPWKLWLKEHFRKQKSTIERIELD